MDKKQDNGIWAYHGTNKENALKIIKNGFNVGTHFAHHIEECLEFGGSWVFRIEWKNKPDNWQFLNKKHIPASKINRLTQYRPIVRIGTQPHLTRKLDSKIEHYNLLGKPLSIKKNKYATSNENIQYKRQKESTRSYKNG